MEALGSGSEGYNIESDMIRRFSERALPFVRCQSLCVIGFRMGTNSMRSLTGLGVFSHIISLISYERPLLSMSVPGLIIVIAGLFLGVYTYSCTLNGAIFPMYMLSLVAGIFTLGVVLIVTGLILNFLVLIKKTAAENTSQT